MRRCEYDAAGTGLELLVSDLEHVVSFEHVEQLVLVLVDMERRVEWLDLLDDGECAVSRVSRRLYDELGVAELEALAGITVEYVDVCPV